MGLNLHPNGRTKNWLKSLGLQLPDNLVSLLTGGCRSISKDGRAGSRHANNIRSAGRQQYARICLPPALRLWDRALLPMPRLGYGGDAASYNLHELETGGGAAVLSGTAVLKVLGVV